MGLSLVNLLIAVNSFKGFSESFMGNAYVEKIMCGF